MEVVRDDPFIHNDADALKAKKIWLTGNGFL
jgi:hypothetical protein